MSREPSSSARGSEGQPAYDVPTALDFPGCRACQMWADAGASWPRPCKQHYGGEPAVQACGCPPGRCVGPCYDFCACDHCYLGWKIPVRDDDPRLADAK